MATRRERVILDLEDNFSGPMARAAAAAALLNRELDKGNRNFDKTSKSTDRLGSSVGSLGDEARSASKDVDRLSERSISSMGRSAEQQGKQIDRLSGRLALFAQAAAVLGPALVPIGAAAVPAIAGLTLELGLAAAAAGVAVLAFQGVGDGLKALDAYQLNPTAQNFAKLSDAMDKLGPAGGEFVLFLDKMEPKLKNIRALAEQGLLPGVQEGLTPLLTQLPKLREIVFNISTTLGDLAASTGKNLAGPEFSQFFDYINSTARPVLTELGQTVGNVFSGITNTVMAFDPVSRDFSTGLLAWSEGFKNITANLDSNQGFQDFISYVQDNGPRAVEALGAVGNALVQLVTAAAPVGAAVLPAITALANAFASLADSSVGPALIGTAAALSVLSRSMALLGVETKGMKAVGMTGGGLVSMFGFEKIPAAVTSVRSLSTATKELAAAQKATATSRGLFAVNSGSVGTYSEALLREVDATERVAGAEKTRAAAVREGAAAAGRGAAAAAGLVVATSGLADGMGLSNTASLALMGTLAGPWGTAIGAGAGLAMDFAKANNNVEDAVKASGRAISGSRIDFTSQAATLKQAQAAFDDYSTSVQKGNAKVNPFDPSTYKNLSGPGDAIKALSDKFSHSKSEMHDAIKSQVADLKSLSDGAKNAFEAFSGKAFSGSPQDLTDWVSKITPALQRAKIDVNDFLDSMSGKRFNPGLMAAGIGAIASSFAEMDSASGRSKAVADALAAMGNQMDSNVGQANALKAAMDSLFGVELSQSAATDAWTQQLRTLGKTIAGTNGAIHGTSAAALTNRDAIRSSVQSLEDKVNADAAAGVSGDKLVGSLVRGRQAIIDQAVAAGASRKSVAQYLHTLGLTPKNLTTVIMADGALSARQKVQALTKLYHLTPKQVKTLVSAAGADPSAAKIRKLAALYHLTPRQVRTLIAAEDKASAKAKAAKKNLNSVHDKSVSIRATENASAKAAKAKGAIKSVRDKSVSIRATENASAAAARARGAINSVQSRTVYINVIRRQMGARDNSGLIVSRGNENGGIHVNGVRQFADGGYGANGRYYSRTPQIVPGGANILWGEDVTGREAYISDKPGMEARNLAILQQTASWFGAQVVQYANGGTRTGAAHKPGPRQQFDLVGGMSMAGVRREFKQFEKAMGGASKRLNGLEGMALRVAHAYNLEERQLKRVQAKSRDLSNSTQSALTHDPFGNGLTGLGDVLQQDKMNALHMASSLKKLKRKGISRGLEAALAASGDSATAMELAKLSRSQINKYDRLYAQRNKAADWAGDLASKQVYGGQIRHLNRTLNHLDKRLNGIEKAAERGTAKGTRQGMNDKSRSSARRRRVRR